MKAEIFCNQKYKGQRYTNCKNINQRGNYPNEDIEKELAGWKLNCEKLLKAYQGVAALYHDSNI